MTFLPDIQRLLTFSAGIFVLVVLSGGGNRQASAATHASPAELNKALQEWRLSYQASPSNKGQLWQQLMQLQSKVGHNSKADDKVDYYKAHMLLKAGYPLSAAYLAQTKIASKSQPFAENTRAWWQILSSSPHSFIMTHLAAQLDMKKLQQKQGLPPLFGRRWLYYQAIHLVQNGQKPLAEKLLGRLTPSDPEYLAASYQRAMIHYETGDLGTALALLKAIQQPTSYSHSPLSAEQKDLIIDYAWLATGRIYYEQRLFSSSVSAFRKVSREGPLYHTALVEQAWPLFMAGATGHALGVLYGAQSPFFDGHFNPESSLLEAMIQFWLCRYEDSRYALKTFLGRYGKAVESLKRFVDRRQMTASNAYQLFDDYVSGVSSQALGIDRLVLGSIIDRDNLRLVRNQLADTLYEIKQLHENGVFGNKQSVSSFLRPLNRMAQHLRLQLGEALLLDFESEKERYEELYNQSQFIYLELLMSETDNLLGRSASVEEKDSNWQKIDAIRGWGFDTQSWKPENLGEFWWDEIGFHIVDAPSQCSN